MKDVSSLRLVYVAPDTGPIHHGGHPGLKQPMTVCLSLYRLRSVPSRQTCWPSCRFTFVSELRSCVKVEVDVLGSRP